MISGSFQVEVQAHHVLIQSKDGFANEQSEELIALLEKLNDSFEGHPAPPFLFMRLREKKELNSTTLNRLARVAVELKKKGQRIYVIGSSQRNTILLSQTGLNDLLRPVASVQEALAQVGAPAQKAPESPRKMSVEFINPFILGLSSTLQKLCKLTIEAQPPRLKKKNVSLPFEVAAATVLEGATLNGAVVLGMNAATFAEILKRWTGKPVTKLTPTQLEGLAELLNMSFGHAKTLLNQKGAYDLRMKIPKAVTHAKTLEDTSCGQAALLLPFRSEIGDLWLQIVTPTNKKDQERLLEKLMKAPTAGSPSQA